MPSPLEATVSEANLPVVDISKFPTDFDAEELNQLQYHPELVKVREACKEWGFFQLVNHGIPVDLVEMADNVSRNLLSMPTEVKDKACSGTSLDTYYRRQNFETFYVRNATNPGSYEQMCAKMYPEKNPILCETFSTYALCVSKLAQKITKIILASLGLDSKAFYRYQFEKSAAVLRINGYKPANMSSEEEKILSHTDMGCLTILYQDDVGGLQIRSQEGEWFNIKPLSNAFVINLGDSFKAWSNGRYRSADHRVVCRGCRYRISIAFFTAFPEDMEIWAPEELVDENNPRRYKPFIYSHFRDEAVRNKEGKEKAAALERFAGI
ncbi:hypothetical protein SUGI_0852170 [Cryptomeria japonica]|nr:hypothetical protein SUGI_0852170 [Cryptomeria japonica]